ncbi:unnamed protein product [Brugia timori]|uniref:G-protein coupled receptors family 1 profile domain-containing protein n=1 Tax=Brugia timori TaxID=42155 RepID=A0A3P8A8Q2_9BILA|nr:unnamed protein product [Brugia timori]
MHNANNILIALSAFGDILHQIGHIPFAYFIFTGITFTLLWTCIWIQLLPNFGLNFAMVILLLTGIDRSIAILKPLSDKVICVLVAIYSGQFDWIWSVLTVLLNLATITLYTALSQIIVKARICELFK